MTVTKKYDILLVDADDTLFDFKKCEHDALKEVLVKNGLESDEPVIAIYSKINDYMWKKLEKNEVTKTELKTERFRRFIGAMEWDIDPKILADGYVSTLPDYHEMLPGAFDALLKVHKNAKVYIITNGIYGIQMKRLNESGIKDNVDGLFISEKLGHEKPSKAFFDAVAAELGGLDPERVLVIGDSLTSDIAGGTNYGLDTLWINRGKKAPEGARFTYTLENFSLVPAFLGL